MVISTKELLLKLNNYSNPNTKIQRLVKEKKLYKIKQGLYETNNNIDPFYLTDIIYGPSYISFQTALAYYDLIPERVYAITCATSNKHKTKTYKNDFGTYYYKDIPANVYPYGIERVEVDGYCYFIASKEKAICDMLYEYKPVYSMKDIEIILFEDLRLNEELFDELDINKLIEIASLYKCINHKFLVKYLKEKYQPTKFVTYPETDSMEKDSILSVIINSDLKRDVEDILLQLGISMDTAISMFFSQIKLNNGLPFTPVLPPKPKTFQEYTEEELKKSFDHASAQYENGEYYTSKQMKEKCSNK